MKDNHNHNEHQRPLHLHRDPRRELRLQSREFNAAMFTASEGGGWEEFQAGESRWANDIEV